MEQKNNVLAIALAIIITVVVVGGGVYYFQSTTQTPQTTVETPTSEDVFYTNEKFGIKFKMHYPEQLSKIEVKDNKVGINIIGDNETDQYLLVFSKKENQSIEDAISDIIKNTGKDPKKCKVIDQGLFYGNKNYEQYYVSLANPITFTKKELEEIEAADKLQKEDPQNAGPVDGEFVKQEIISQRYKDFCAISKNPPGPGTSSRTSDTFISNKKSQFVFVPGSADPMFYDIESIELLK